MLKKLFVHQSDHVAVQFVRYGFVAVAAFIVDFGLLVVFKQYLHIYYLLAATMSFLISLVLNYYLSTLWVFSKSKYRRSVEATMFLAVGLVGLVLNVGIIWVCTALFGLFYAVSKIIAVLIVFFWSFLARRYLFRGQTAPEA